MSFSVAATECFASAGEGGLPVPRQNRVDPFGEIIAIPERGTFLGNRGVLHDAGGHIKRAWQVKRWLVCVLEFRALAMSFLVMGHSRVGNCPTTV